MARRHQRLAARRAVVGFDAAFGDAFLLATGMVVLGAALAIARVRRLRSRAASR